MRKGPYYMETDRQGGRKKQTNKPAMVHLPTRPGHSFRPEAVKNRRSPICEYLAKRKSLKRVKKGLYLIFKP